VIVLAEKKKRYQQQQQLKKLKSCQKKLKENDEIKREKFHFLCEGVQ
jgi:hypothetical protein